MIIFEMAPYGSGRFQMVPDERQKGPRGLQRAPEGSRGLQRAPGGSERSQRTPREIPGGPRELPEAPKTFIRPLRVL